MDTEKDKIIRKGERAAKARFRRDANPYTRGTPEFVWWLMGFNKERAK